MVSAMDIQRRPRLRQQQTAVSNLNYIYLRSNIEDNLYYLGSHLVPSTSTGITREFCGECNQTLVNRKLEIENLKTKNKLDHLKMVMQQKKEKREARKLKIAPYNAQMGAHASMENQTSLTTLELPMISAMNRNLMMPGSTTSLNESAEETASSSSATATAIATSIPTNNSEIENHLEEVDTAA